MAVSFYSKAVINLHDSTPVFNKRIFKAQAGIVITEEIMAILKRPLSEERSKIDLHKLKSVVNGLRDIHKDLQFIKDALCYVVGYEKVGPNVQVKKQSTETHLSCYYILNGSIEATYVIENGDQEERKKNKSGIESFHFQDGGADCKRCDGYEIKYTHVAGDYLGLVSGDGPEYDLPPPHSIRTIEVCEFLRIDQNKFHQAVRKIHSHHVQEIEHFINSGSILRNLPLEERQRLVPLTARQEYAAGKVIVNQGEFPEHIFFVGKGRCQFIRRVSIKEARRLELVKLGHIEQGDVFGESSVLDASPCFCSVSTIGQVTCYLINKWAIKHNEYVLNLLREHQHHFYEDCTIQHYIRDSDIWQSYKRSKINELLETTNKQHIIIEKKHVPEPLAIAVDFGDAKRSHSSQPLRREREPGEPESKQPLFVVPRFRRKSSAILQSNAAPVVKAILLLRRNVEDNSKEPLRLPKVKTQELGQQSRVKPNSAPGRYRSFIKTSHSQEESNISIKCDNKNVQFRKKSALENGRRPKSVNEIHSTKEGFKCLPKGREVSNGCTSSIERQKFPTSRRVTLSENTDERKKKKGRKNVTKFETYPMPQTNTVSQKSKDQENTQSEKKHKASASGMEKFVSKSGNFIVKEIINTGNPKRLSSPQGYQRFGLSMFAILDDEKSIENTRQVGLNPWGVSYAASKWMAGIRKKRLSILNGREQGSSPVPTPLIVIEEYAPENSWQQSDEKRISTDSDCSSEEVKVHSDKDSIHTRKMSRNSRGTPSPSLEQLKEEGEEDIKEYDKHAAGKAVEESWYTPIHKARDQSHSCLEQLRKELEVLRCSRSERRRRHGRCEKETTTTIDYQLANGVKKEDTENQRKNETETTEESSQSSTNQRHRQRKYSTRKGPRTQYTSTAPDTQTIDQDLSKNSDSPRMWKRFSNVQIRNIKGDEGLTEPHEFILAEDARKIEKKAEKHEKRRLLLLKKLGL